jgi:hypothetical protein
VKNKWAIVKLPVKPPIERMAEFDSRLILNVPAEGLNHPCKPRAWHPPCMNQKLCTNLLCNLLLARSIEEASQGVTWLCTTSHQITEILMDSQVLTLVLFAITFKYFQISQCLNFKFRVKPLWIMNKKLLKFSWLKNGIF